MESAASDLAAAQRERAHRPGSLYELAWIAALVVCAVAPTLGFGLLAWDDPLHVTKNPLVTSGGAALLDRLTTPALGYPIPLTVASYRLEYALFGLTAWVFHLTNALLHLGSVVLVFLLGRRLGVSPRGAALGALVFGLHPAAAEAVSWVTGRKDLLACILGLAALWFAGARFRGARALALTCYALGLLSKPSVAPLAVMVPAFSGRLDEVREQPGAVAAVVRGLAREVWPYLLVLAPVAYLGVVGQSSAGANEESYAPLARLHAAWYAFGHHAALALFSEEPTVKYAPSPWPPTFPSKPDWAGMALIALVVLACVRLRGSSGRASRRGAAFALLTYLPASGLPYPLSRYLADSYVYLPLVGLGFIAGASHDALALRLSGRLKAWLRHLPWLFGCALLPLFLASSVRFRDDLALWSHAIERFPHHPRICRQWANASYHAHGAEAGLAAVDRCIERFGPQLFEKNRGLLLLELGRASEARRWLEAARQRRAADPAVESSLRLVEPAEPER